jgi:hypothetical protein
MVSNEDTSDVEDAEAVAMAMTTSPSQQMNNVDADDDGGEQNGYS